MAWLVISAFFLLFLLNPVVFNLDTDRKIFTVSYLKVFHFVIPLDFKKKSPRVIFPGHRVFHYIMTVVFKRPVRKKADKPAQKKERPAQKEAPRKYATLFRYLRRILTNRRDLKILLTHPIIPRAFKLVVAIFYGKYALLKIKRLHIAFSHKQHDVQGMLTGLAGMLTPPEPVVLSPNFIDRNFVSLTVWVSPFYILRYLVFLLIAFPYKDLNALRKRFAPA